MASKKKIAPVFTPGWISWELNWERGCDATGHNIPAGRMVVTNRDIGCVYCIPCALFLSRPGNAYFGAIITNYAEVERGK